VLIAAQFIAAASVVAQDVSADGQDPRQYPPHRLVDHQHMALKVWIADMNTPRLEAVETLTVEPIMSPVSTITLDAHAMDISGVESPGRETTYTYDGDVLTITLDPPLQPGEPAKIITSYAVTDPPRGLIWTPESKAWPGRAAQLHTQGETNTNSWWFPCRDHPNDRLTTELTVTVPSGFLVSSNGRLVSRERTIEPTAGDNALRSYETFHWLQDKEHVSYLVSLIVGKFDEVDVGGPTTARPGLEMPVLVPPGRARDVDGTYGRTPEMIALFERLLDEPYPWDRYAQIVVYNFGPHGMENTSATTMFDTAIISRADQHDHSLEGLISHELAHQWFGDLITCRSWDHIWLNEGFATYMTALWYEHTEGADAYQASIRGKFDSMIAGDKGTLPDTPAMVSKLWEHPGETFGRASNPYPKGASILHMLRVRLGDEAFFKGLALYVDRHKFTNVETNDLRKVFEEVSGDGLERFFWQWCMRPGVPRLDIAADWDAEASELVIAAEQTQQIDPNNPAFAFTLPVLIVGSGGQETRLNLEMQERELTKRVRLDSEPMMVAFDPDMAVLAEMKIAQPAARWIAQLRDGPTYATRIQAARALANDSSTPAADALVATALDRVQHASLRSAAIASLADRGDLGRVLDLVRAPIEAYEVRASALSALSDVTPGVEDPEARALCVELLAKAVRTDPSTAVRAAAVRALGKAKAMDKLHVVLAAADVDSHDDEIRTAALRALSNMNSEAGLVPAIRSTAPGVYNRTRPVAINTIVKLAHHDPDRAFRAIAPLTLDRERRTWESACRALADLGDPRGLDVLNNVLDAHNDARDRQQIRQWIDTLQNKIN
jgi:aminopeptidase N